MFAAFSSLVQGSWAPSMNVPTLLTTIRLLMAHPNGDDGLMPDIVSLVLIRRFYAIERLVAGPSPEGGRVEARRWIARGNRVEPEGFGLTWISDWGRGS